MTSIPPGLLDGLQMALNRYLRLDPDAGARMTALQGRSIAIELTLPRLTFYILPGETGLQLRSQLESDPDTVLRGTALGLARLGLGSQAGKTLFSGSVSITGDVETGQAFKAALDAMDIDWEEQLSRFTGDVIAHRLGNLARKGDATLRRARHTLEQDLGEYLQEELRVLPTHIEVENFCADVTRLRIDSDRLQARIRRLQSPPATKVDRR